MTSMMRPGRGDITTMRVDRNTASGMEWVTKITVLRVSCHRREELEVEVVANDLVEGAERLVHQQQLRIEGKGAGDGGALLHAARQLPGELALEALEIDELEVAPGALASLGRRIAHDLERQHDVALDGAPRIEGRCLEHIAVLALESRLAGGEVVDADGAAGRLLEIGDDAEQRGLAAARGTDQRDEIAGLDVEIDVGQGEERTVSGVEGQGETPRFDDTAILRRRRHRFRMTGRLTTQRALPLFTSLVICA